MLFIHRAGVSAPLAGAVLAEASWGAAWWRAGLCGGVGGAAGRPPLRAGAGAGGGRAGVLGGAPGSDAGTRARGSRGTPRRAPRGGSGAGRAVSRRGSSAGMVGGSGRSRSGAAARRGKDRRSGWSRRVRGRAAGRPRGASGGVWFSSPLGCRGAGRRGASGGRGTARGGVPAPLEGGARGVALRTVGKARWRCPRPGPKHPAGDVPAVFRGGPRLRVADPVPVMAGGSPNQAQSVHNSLSRPSGAFVFDPTPYYGVAPTPRNPPRSAPRPGGGSVCGLMPVIPRTFGCLPPYIGRLIVTPPRGPSYVRWWCRRKVLPTSAR